MELNSMIVGYDQPTSPSHSTRVASWLPRALVYANRGRPRFALEACGKELSYVNFESPLERAEFETDPNGFLDQRVPNGC